jgi:hypothetical protein
VLLAAEGLILIAVAVILAVPVPLALARAAWPARSPRAALVLWQAVGLGGGLAILGAGVTLAVSGLHRSWLGGLAVLPNTVLPDSVLPGSVPHRAAGHLAGPGVLGWAGVALTVVAGAWLLAVLVISTTRLLLARREHRRRLDLLAEELLVEDLIPAARRAGERPAAASAAGEIRAGGGLGPPGPTGAGGMPGRGRRAPLMISGDPAAGGVVSVAMDPERVAAGREPDGPDGPTRPDGPDGPAEPDGPDAGRALSPGLRVRLLDHPVVAAYCLPGVRPRIVLSQGVLDVLTGAQLAAVVGHERAHARGQHDLVILPFRAWRQTFPFLPSAGAALGAVELLVELLADDTASRRGGAGPLLAALRRLADAAPGDVQVAARTARLGARPARLSRLATAVVYLAAVALVGLPPAILLLS